jgi:hypothetical protein
MKLQVNAGGTSERSVGRSDSTRRSQEFTDGDNFRIVLPGFSCAKTQIHRKDQFVPRPGWQGFAERHTISPVASRRRLRFAALLAGR